MAPAVILIGCLLATMSCLTTAFNTTADPPFITTADPPLNSTADPPLNSTADPPLDPTADPSFIITATTPKDGSCANPNLCCSGVNDSCFHLNCYCDVACLRFGDCCPDFKPTCLTVNNSSNGTEPDNPLTLTGTCSQPTLCCSGVDYNCFRGCFCDEACKQLNDCCPDLNSTCTFNATTADPSLDPTADPPFIITAATTKVTTVTSNPSRATSIPITTRPGVTNATTTTTTQTPAHGSCANPDLCCSGVNDSCFRLNCFCDVACLRFGDCCPDFKPTCLTVNNSSNGTKPNNTLTLTGTCSQPTLCCSGVNFDCFRGCFCDEACKQLNDCCPDLNSTCIFNTTTTAPPVTSTTAPPNDVLSFLTNLDVEVLAEESSTEEERQAALRQVGALLESLLRVNNTDIYSFEVTRIEPVSSSPCD